MNILNSLNRFLLIAFLKYVFKCLKIENGLSLIAVVTGKEAKIIKNLYIVGYICLLHSAKLINTFFGFFFLMFFFYNENSL